MGNEYNFTRNVLRTRLWLEHQPTAYRDLLLGKLTAKPSPLVDRTAQLHALETKNKIWFCLRDNLATLSTLH